MTRQEFVAAVQAGKGPTKAESFTVDRRFDDVYAQISRNVPKCLAKLVKRSGGAAGPAHASSSQYRPSFKKDGGKGVFTLQVLHNPRGVGVKQPDDGIYVMAADVTPAGGKTKVDLWYGTWGYGQIADGFAKMAKGSGDACPDLK
jgi:hypothetical protein